ncbi:MAG: hypothetical protein IJU78_01485 [Clostridia bacterium]|nr:hypothetical protein [Clostridia bacterium]
MNLTNTQEVILRLKAIKKENELTLPRIMDMIEANGDYLSMTTLRRVFAASSEQDDSFSYDKTIRPIARALLFQDEYDGKESVSPSMEIEGLKAVIRLKNEEIDLMKEQIEAIKGVYERRVAFLLDQIDKKDKRMDEKDKLIQKLMENVL